MVKEQVDGLASALSACLDEAAPSPELYPGGSERRPARRGG
jgi:hypothetical protein